MTVGGNDRARMTVMIRAIYNFKKVENDLRHLGIDVFRVELSSLGQTFQNYLYKNFTREELNEVWGEATRGIN